MSDKFYELNDEELEHVTGGSVWPIAMHGNQSTANTMQMKQHMSFNANTQEYYSEMFSAMTLEDIQNISPTDPRYWFAWNYLQMQNGNQNSNGGMHFS